MVINMREICNKQLPMVKANILGKMENGMKVTMLKEYKKESANIGGQMDNIMKEK